MRIHKIIADPPYFFGRFYALRKQYANLQHLLGKQATLAPGKQRIFDFDKKKCLADLHHDAIAFGIDLPQEYVTELRDFALKNPLQRWNGGDIFHYHEVENGRTPSGPVGIAEVLGKEQCPVIEAIVHEPSILDTVSGYLGYRNLGYRLNLFWTFMGDISPQERIAMNQTIEYHFDVQSWNFCYLHIYLTDCDRYTGAHEMVKGSHRNKPASWLWGSAKRSDASVLEQYSPENLLTVEGKAGTGFFEDTSCYHRALAPLRANRLLLQVRYF